MGFLSGGFAAGQGSDALETLLSRLFTEGQAKIRNEQEAQRIAQDAERLKMEAADRAERIAATRGIQAQTSGLKLAGTLRPKQEITQGQADTLTAGGLEDKIVAPTLGSRNIGPGMASTANPGRGTSFAGLPAQLEEEAQNEELKRQITVAPPALRGRLTMASLLPPDKRAGAISEVMREEAKPPERSPALREYQDAVSQGYKGTFEQYQTADANRKRPVVNVNAGQAQAAADAKAQAQQNEVQDALDVIRQIRDDPARTSSTGPFEGRGAGYATAGPEGFERVKRLHNNLVDKLALAQAGKLKGQGAISNFEREMLKNAATALSLSLGDKDYETQLGKLEEQFKRMLTPGATPAPPAGGGKPTETPEQRLARLMKAAGGG